MLIQLIKECLNLDILWYFDLINHSFLQERFGG